jgi:hypothetical protein
MTIVSEVGKPLTFRDSGEFTDCTNENGFAQQVDATSARQVAELPTALKASSVPLIFACFQPV